MGTRIAFLLSIATTACAVTDGTDLQPGEPPIELETVAEVAVPTPALTGTTIHDIQRPDSAIAEGAHVGIAHRALRVTAQSERALWVQEVDATGLCDDGTADRVAFRAIRVEPASSERRYAVGAWISVEGDVMTVDGRRRIVHAAVVERGLAGPYRAHCDRGGSFDEPAFEAVLVQTAGRAGESLPPTGEAWALGSCFGPTIRIEPAMQPTARVQGTWRWVTGVVQQTADDRVIQPRTSDEVTEAGDDACL